MTTIQQAIAMGTNDYKAFIASKQAKTERKRSAVSIDTLIARVIAKHGESYGMSMVLNHSRNGHIRNRKALEKALLEPCESAEHKARRKALELQYKELIGKSAIAKKCELI